MKHPYQQVLLNSAGTVLFATCSNNLFVFKLTNSSSLIGSWTDEVDPDYTLKKRHEAWVKSQEEKGLNNQPDAKPPKLPTPGPGAPPRLNYIRDICLSRDEQHVIVSTDNDKAVVVFNLDLTNTTNVLSFVKRQPFPKRPCTITTTVDDKNIVIGDKFGDVYTIDLQGTAIVEEKDLKPVLGHVSMLTSLLDLTDSNGKEYIITSDRDEHIRVTHYPQTYVIKKWLFEHEEFVSSIIAPNWCDGKVLVSAGGDKFVCSWVWQETSDELQDKLLLDEIVKPYLTDKHLAPERFQNEAGDLQEYTVSQILAIEKLNKIAILFDKMNAFFLFDLSKDGEITFDKAIETSNDIISGTCSDERLVFSVNDPENLLESYQLTQAGELVPEDEGLLGNIYQSNTVDPDGKDDILLSLSVGQLRKRREH